MVLKITTLLINKITNYLLWLLFLGNLTYLIYNFPTIPEIYFGDVLRINGFTVLIWTLVTFSVRCSYGKNYLKGLNITLNFTVVFRVYVFYYVFL
jgi:NAD(P)H-quinone oxidoreductase subunit 5